MIIAREKKANNIAEYLIYMFQVEDMIRASNFDIDTIYRNVISQFKVSKIERDEIRTWYLGLIDMMKQERIEKTGHLQFINNTIKDLQDFHHKLLKIAENSDYYQLYQTALPHIEEFRNKSKASDFNEIEICLNGLYSLFLLRLQKREISKETLTSFNTFSQMLAYLSVQYKKYENGELEF